MKPYLSWSAYASNRYPLQQYCDTRSVPGDKATRDKLEKNFHSSFEGGVYAMFMGLWAYEVYG